MPELPAHVAELDPSGEELRRECVSHVLRAFGLLKEAYLYELNRVQRWTWWLQGQPRLEIEPSQRPVRMLGPVELGEAAETPKSVLLLELRDLLGECLGHVKPAAIHEVGERGLGALTPARPVSTQAGHAAIQDRRSLPVAACRPL